MLGKAGRGAEAMDALQRAVELDASRADSARLLGLAREREGRQRNDRFHRCSLDRIGRTPLKKLRVILPFKYGGERLDPGDTVEMNESHERLYKHLGLIVDIQKPVRRTRKK